MRERVLATNHLGHYALTCLLLPHLTDRVVVVASNAHRGAKLDVDDLNWEHRRYRPAAAYGQSKLANLLFVAELQRRLDAVGSTLRALAAHPGASATNLNSHMAWPLRLASATVGRLVLQDAATGALPTLFAATQDLPGNTYVGPRGFRQQRGLPTIVDRSVVAADSSLARALWDRSEQLTGVGFPAELPTTSRGRDPQP